jgi:hypothetical protein
MRWISGKTLGQMGRLTIGISLFHQAGPVLTRLFCAPDLVVGEIGGKPYGLWFSVNLSTD